jgi:preprotein translocase subunit SecG
MHAVLLVIHSLLALGIIGLVLIQRSEGDGFGASTGGSGLISGQAKANFFTRATAVLAAGFMLSSLLLGIMVNRRQDDSLVDSLKGAPAMTAPAPAENSATPEGEDAPKREVPLAE